MKSLLPIHRHLGRKTPVVVLAALMLLALPVGARAGTYVINDCPSANSSAEAGPWVVYGSPGKAKTTCAGTTEKWIGPVGTMTGNSVAEVEATVPSGTDITIKEAKVWWIVPYDYRGSDVFAVAWGGETDLGGGQAKYEGWPSNFTLPANSKYLSLHTVCSNDKFEGCEFGPSGLGPALLMFGAELTLSDTGKPSGGVTGGGLAGSGPVGGKQSLKYLAADTEVGVRDAELLLDGKAVAKTKFTCSYTNFVACPVKEESSLSYETKNTTNGSHEVALKVINAAGNSRTVDAHKIKMEN